MSSSGKRILVTGSAGFVGFHICRRLLDEGAAVLGVDSFTSYYDVALKEARNAILERYPNFSLARLSIEDMDAFGTAWRAFAAKQVIHLAAQAGVRFSVEEPRSYIRANIVGTFNLMELARHHPVDHLLIASTSSVYGANTEMPFVETQRTQTPLSFYAATKGATELMGHSYSHLFGIPMTFFRFFTVYGPWGRPDMALFKFTRAILAGEPIDIYNNGRMTRDFTYIDDLVEAVVRLAEAVPGNAPIEGDSLSAVAPHRIVNIGGGRSTELMDYIAELEKALGCQAAKNFLPLQEGDLVATEASSDLLHRLTGYAPSTTASEGVPKFVDWYREHYRL